MSQTYKHLTLEQRVKIKKMLDDGCRQVEIAKALSVSEGTISREIKRGSDNGEYNPDYSEKQYREQLTLRKGPRPLLSMNSDLAEHIAELIVDFKMSPEQIVIQLQEAKGFDNIPKSATTIYNAIDNGLIPGVTRESLNSDITSVFGDGQLCIPKWVRIVLNIKDGDKLQFEVIQDKLVFKKIVK